MNVLKCIDFDICDTDATMAYFYANTFLGEELDVFYF